MNNQDSFKKVLVTGATGYVAGWVIKKLLEKGHDVHATVRNLKNEKKREHLVQLAKHSTGKITFFEADLLKKGSFDEAANGCHLIYHTASPFLLDVKDNLKQLVEPALEGTANVLSAANKNSSVKRVVVTSSVAAIYGDAIDLNTTKNNVFTEEDWNESSSINHQAYSYSKVMAEKEAWKIAKSQNQWDLVTVNPSLVIGPSLNNNATSASFDIFKQMADGTLRFGAPALNIGMIDVRDVADIHYWAGFNPSAKGRYLSSAKDASILEISKILTPKYGDKYPLPKRLLPKFLVKLLAPFVGMTRKEVENNIGHPWKADHSKLVKEMNIQFRPLEVAANEMFQQMIDAEIV